MVSTRLRKNMRTWERLWPMVLVSKRWRRRQKIEFDVTKSSKRETILTSKVTSLKQQLKDVSSKCNISKSVPWSAMIKSLSKRMKNSKMIVKIWNLPMKNSKLTIEVWNLQMNNLRPRLRALNRPLRSQLMLLLCTRKGFQRSKPSCWS